MRFIPTEISAAEKEKKEKRTLEITEKIAVGFAFISVFIFFFKILFF